jgi:hypothetical protein
VESLADRAAADAETIGKGSRGEALSRLEFILHNRPANNFVGLGLQGGLVTQLL